LAFRQGGAAPLRLLSPQTTISPGLNPDGYVLIFCRLHLLLCLNDSPCDPSGSAAGVVPVPVCPFLIPKHHPLPHLYPLFCSSYTPAPSNRSWDCPFCPPSHAQRAPLNPPSTPLRKEAFDISSSHAEADVPFLASPPSMMRPNCNSAFFVHRSVFFLNPFCPSTPCILLHQLQVPLHSSPFLRCFFIISYIPSFLLPGERNSQGLDFS